MGDTAKGILLKLLKVQTELKVPKSQYNIFGKYYYRNCEDIQEAVKPYLLEEKAVLLVGDEVVKIDERFYIKATARLIDIETGEEISNTAYAREENEKKGMDLSQLTGSTSSYARKYALNGLFCIDDNKDADNCSNKNINEEQFNIICAELKRTGVGLKNLLGNYNLSSIDQMTMVQYEDAIERLRKKGQEEVPPPATEEQLEQMIGNDEIEEGLPWSLPKE